MALEVASVALDTPTWAEWSTVSFNVGTLNNLSAMIDAVSDKLNRAPITATTKPSDQQVADFIVRAKEELAEIKSYDFLHRYVTGTMTASTYRYSLPPDCNKILTMRDKTNDTRVVILEPWIFDEIYPDMEEETSGQIRHACQKNRELWISPPPDSADVVELEYERDGDDNDPADISWLPEIERWRCVDFALAESWEILNQYKQSNHYSSKWAKHVGKGKRTDNRRKLKGARARGLFG